MKNLEICLQALQVGKYEKEIVLRTVTEIENCSLQDLSTNRKLVADVFFQLLQYCQKLYDATNTLEELKEPILNTLKNIEQISTEATEEEKSCSSVTILWFLHELKTHGALGTLQHIDDTYLQDKIYVLLEELEKIYFIFEIQEDGKYVFPIHDMLQKVITNPEFSEISKDEKFMRKDENTLYVPKDGRRSDSVLNSIYEKYLKSKSVREKNDLFDDSIELKNNKYYHNGKCIKKIVFLSDNFEKGGSTKRMIKAYLNMDISHDSESEQQYVRNAKERSQKYYMTDKTGNKLLVDIDDIVEKNNCSLEIHAYFGTKEGLEEIKQFLVEKDIKNSTVSYGREIIKKESQINDELQRLGEKWKRTNSDVYTVIREFNMTKGNVFPEEMLKNPQKAICMFVKKKEVYCSRK